MSTTPHGIKHFFQPTVRLGKRMTVRGIGLQERMPPCIINRPVGTGDWLFMAFGTPAHVGDSDGDLFRGEPCAILWPPYARQFYGNEQASYVHSWMHADGPQVAQLVREAGLPTNRVFPVTDWHAMETPLRMLLAELREERAPDTRIALSYVEILFRTLARGRAQPEPQLPTAIRTVRDYLEAHLADAITLDRLAELAHCSEPYLCETFRKWLGMPPIDYLINLRIHKATYHLHDTNLRIGEIARLVGYDDIYYFSRLYRKRTGASPRAMRQRLLAGAK